MKLLSTLFPALLIAPTSAVKCGQWYSSDCVADHDIRYDKDHTNDLKELAPIWARKEGFWIGEFLSFLNPLTGESINKPTFYNPNFPTLQLGLNFPYIITKAFYNETFIGSRYYSDRYYIHPPADEEFCNSSPPPGFSTTAGSGTCGVNGFSLPARSAGVASYEKDGNIHIISSTYAGVSSVANQSALSVQSMVDERTFHSIQEVPDIKMIASSAGIFLNNYTQISGSLQTYIDSRIISSTTYQWTKVTEEEWLKAIEETYEEYNVLSADRIQGGKLPMQTECIDPENCVSEELWCKFDPECSESPYQEPDATVRAGPIVGLVLLGVAILFALAYLWHRRQIAKIMERNRSEFARRIAETIDLSGSARQMTPEALAAEFQRIDDDKNGTISKEELWDFLNSGKAGQISRKDFDVLFVSIDLDRSGTVDFMEFFSFMGQCHGEFEKVKNRKSVRQARPSFAATLSKSVSTRRGTDFASAMAQVKEEDEASDELPETQDITDAADKA